MGACIHAGMCICAGTCLLAADMHTCCGHVGLCVCDCVFIGAGVNMKALDHHVGRRSDGPSEGGGECHLYQKL